MSNDTKPEEIADATLDQTHGGGIAVGNPGEKKDLLGGALGDEQPTLTKAPVKGYGGDTGHGPSTF